MRFSLEQFAEVFQIRDAAGRPYVLIGGQAVNYWAERYFPVEPALRQLLPFTSEDIDFRGNREDVQRIADQLKQPALYPPKVAMTALAGVVPFRIGSNSSNIEVVRRIPGIAPAAVEALAIETEWAGRRLRVLDPISLLVGKLELALTVSQTKRRDAEHVRILIYCVRGFLREFLAGVEAGELPVKGWLGAVNRVLKLSTTTHGRKAAQRLKLDWCEAVPLEEIGHSREAKVIKLQAEQLSRWSMKLGEAQR